VRYARIYCDADGASHWADVEIDLSPVAYAPPSPAIDVSVPFVTTSAVLFSIPAGWYGDWHPTPRRQLYVILSGRLEVTTTGGETRTLAPGDIVLVEDEVAPGHITRAVGEGPSTGIFIHLAEPG